MGSPAGRIALDDQEVEEEAPPVAPLLGLELVEQGGRAEAGSEERHHRLQLRVAVGRARGPRICSKLAARRRFIR
jgi:hypothetical protein